LGASVQLCTLPWLGFVPDDVRAAPVVAVGRLAERLGVAAGNLSGYAARGQTRTFTARLWSADDTAVSLANSSVYLEAVGHTVIAWMWLEQLTAVDGKDGDFYDGKRHAARYFYTHELPKVGPQMDLLASLDRTALDMNPTWF
jgi:hypothetical protein